MERRFIQPLSWLHLGFTRLADNTGNILLSQLRGWRPLSKAPRRGLSLRPDRSRGSGGYNLIRFLA